MGDITKDTILDDDNVRELENKLISLCLKSQTIAMKAKARLKTSDFAHPQNKRVFAAIFTLLDKNKDVSAEGVIDVITQDSERDFPNCVEYVQQLETLCYDDHKVNTFIDAIKKASIKIKLNRVCENIRDEHVSIGNCQEKINRWLREISDATHDSIVEESKSIEEVMLEITSGIEKQKNDNFIINTGFSTLDSSLKINKGEITVIAGSPGTGKSTFALNICDNILSNYINSVNLSGVELDNFIDRDDKKIYFFSLEMKTNQIVPKLISKNCGRKVEQENVRTLLNDDSVLHAIDTVRRYDRYLKIDESSENTIETICSKACELAASNDLKLIIIDHFHIISREHRDEINEQANISHKLKALAKKLDIPIIVLSQVNKQGNNYGAKSYPNYNKHQATYQNSQTFDTSNELTLGSLKGSSAIVDDAANVLLMWSEDKGIIVKIGKARYGAKNDQFKFVLKGETSTFILSGNGT